MNSYETSATVEDQGQVHLDGVPFAPGTEVEVTITPITNRAESPTGGKRRDYRSSSRPLINREIRTRSGD